MTKLIRKGNNGSSLELQPDWTIESDGYGLLTSRLTFKCDASSAAGKSPKSGEAHPKDGRLKCHKSTYTITRGDWATVVSDYVGIETGDQTKMQIKGDVVTGTQPIQVHKDFLAKLKPLGWDSATQSFPETNAKAVQNSLVGVKSFLTPDSQINCVYYSSSRTELQAGVNMVSKTFQKLGGLEDVVLPAGNQGLSKFHDRFALLSGLNYEKFAHLYKISFSIRISSGGWHNLIYTKQN